MSRKEQISGFCPKNDPTQGQGGAQPQASNTLTQGRRMRGAKDGGGQRGFAGELDSEIDFIKPYIPSSWFHPIGVWKKRAEILSRLPNLKGSLFLTFTVDPKFFEGELSAYETSRAKLRKVFFALRRGIRHEGRDFKIDAPYFTKTEFHKSGFAHFHVIFRTRSFLPPKVVSRLWGLGRVNVKRIRTKGLEYLLKYVTKGEDLPSWVKNLSRIRIVQPSKGFYKTSEERRAVTDLGKIEVEEADVDERPTSKRPAQTIGERITKWAKMAVIRIEGCYRTLVLNRPYFEILSELIYPLARSRRYLGNWVVRINRISDLLDWEPQN